MRSLPAELDEGQVREALADGWGIGTGTMAYVPEGGGAYHWQLVATQDNSYFVTVDDLDGKPWLGETRSDVTAKLRQAMITASALRHQAGLKYVVAPIPGLDGEFLQPAGGRYSVSLFPFLPGRSYAFGPYPHQRLRVAALKLIARLHQATHAIIADVPGTAPPPTFAGRPDLEAFLADPGEPWPGGPFSEPARSLLMPHLEQLSELIHRFDRLAASTAPAGTDIVVTHGEPHPANLRSAAGQLYLVDWDTVALARPERDIALITTASTDTDSLDQYRKLTGRELNPDAICLYRLRWYLDDLASAVRLFRRAHHDTADLRLWWQGLPPRLAQLHNPKLERYLAMR